MEDPTSGAQLILTPHPITLAGQQHIAAEMLPGEKLGPFLARTVPDWHGDAWEVRINGVIVPHEVLARVRPKTHAIVEVRGIVKRQVLAIVAIAVLAYFTMGAGATWAAGLGAVGASVAYAVTFAVGSALINKVLMPKPPQQSAQQSDPVYSINSARSAPRPYEPLPLLFGTVRITPDVASMPYTWYEGNDQILGMVLTPGINVHSVEALYNGTTLLSTYEGVQTYLNGLPGHADQVIPLYSNADTLAGGELNEDTTWVERTTPLDTVRVQINLEYILGDATSKGKPSNNQETVEAQYRATGSGTWLALVSRRFVSSDMDQKRATLAADLPRGQYDVRVRRKGEHTWEGPERNAKAVFQWVTMTAVQADDTDYTGIPRIGLRIKATGQLNGALDEVRTVAQSQPVPVWNGAAWTTAATSNPGAFLLQYARGIYDSNGRLLAGMGLPDAMIDIPALQAFMVHCASNGYSYNAYIKDARNHAEMTDALALAGMGQVTWAGGKFSVAWAAQGQPISAVANMANIKRASFQVDYTLANAADGIEYSYVDPETWTAVTLRVEAPDITTMQNPARISGEGITSEAHAAEMARYHLAQSLYQYKDISFGQDLEYLSYRRLSVLSLSHDLTQWGYSGRLRGASVVGGVVSVALDEPVPAGSTPYIGLRIPGEGAFRVFAVQPFTGETDTLTLVGDWPEDAYFPGDSADNPAHDTIWTFDFKPTPGYRVRVVSIQPESDLKGARIAVVPESPEFWTYVKTGAYTPPVNQSLLLTRPVASNLTIAESQVVQGDTVFTELQADFDIEGPMAYATVHAAQLLDGTWSDLRQVAETRTQEARFRIPSAGAYRIVVRPYNADGIVGGVATVDYITEAADIPPPPFDIFEVQALAGGVRKYTWAYNSTTLQAPDFAGAEVRYIADTHATPDWAAMTPVGNADGFHPAAFEAVVPASGTWTFAARARNTSGELSAPVVITRTLAENLGEVIGGIEQDIDEALAEQVALQDAIDQANADRLAGDLAEATARGEEVATLTNQIIAVSSRAAGSGNLLQNAGFESDLSGWSIQYINAPDITIERNMFGQTYYPDGENAAVFWVVGFMSNSDYVGYGQRQACIPGRRYMASAWFGTVRSRCNVQLVFYDQAGAIIPGSTVQSTVGTAGSGAWANYVRHHAVGNAPALAVEVACIPVMWGNNQPNANMWVVRPMLEEVPAGKTEPSPWSEGARGLSTAVVELRADTDAQITIATNVDGHVSGLTSINDGTSSSFSILATVFRVLGFGSTGMEWQDGYLRIWKGASQLVLGNSFGSAGNLVLWFGPNIGAAACTKANGKIWFDNAADCYFGGSISAGILTAARQSTQLGPTATVSTGDFGSNGGSRVVTCSLGYARTVVVSGNNPVSATFTGTLQLRRGVTNIASAPITITYESNYDAETNTTGITANGGASLTYTDTSGGTLIEYNALITGASGNWNAAVGGGVADQRLSVISTEQP